MFAKVIKHTPLFNCKNFPLCFQGALKLDHRQLLKELETVLYKGSVVQVLEVEQNIATVKTKEYGNDEIFYLDARFLNMHEEEPPQRKASLPTKEKIISSLQNFPNCSYIWGGTDPEGVPSWSTYYPPSQPLSPFEFDHWHFKGVDCSGLLYNVTNGFTPRNTSQLYNFGNKVTHLRPLDIVLHKGHVMIVLSSEKIIESRHQHGIVITNLKNRLKESEHLGLEYRRWYS